MIRRSSLLCAAGCYSHGFFDRTASERIESERALVCDATGYGLAELRVLSPFLHQDSSSQDSPSQDSPSQDLSSAMWGFASVRQKHTSRVVMVCSRDSLWSDLCVAPRADGIVTDLPGLLLAVYTADCAPVLFSDCVAGVCAVAHAGWRGALGEFSGLDTDSDDLQMATGDAGGMGDADAVNDDEECAGIIEAVVAGMVDLGANRARISVALGPMIGLGSYRVSDDFASAFLSKKVRLVSDNRVFFVRHSDGLHFDLGGYVVARLRGCGITSIDLLGIDTHTDSSYYSHRRLLRDGSRDGGRNFSCIALS